MKIIEDPIYRTCIETAMRGSSKLIKFGSVLTIPGVEETFCDRNRLKNPLIDTNPRLLQGYALHGEVAVLQTAIAMGHNPRGGIVYTAGLFPGYENGKTIELYLPAEPTYSCGKCPAKLLEVGVEYLAVPTPEGWSKLTIQDAMDLYHANFTYREGASLTEQRKQIGRVVVEFDQLFDS